MNNTAFQIRVTGVLVREGKLLLVKQRVGARRWSLPGGRAEAGETLEQALVREMREETGLAVTVRRLLYVCDVPDASPPLVHITFLLNDLSGEIRLPDNTHDENPISDVRFIPIDTLPTYGFSERFTALARENFPGAGRYMGRKSAIGL